VPVLPPSCTFTVTLNLTTQSGGFTLTTMCQGALETQDFQYAMVNGDDSLSVFIQFSCGGVNYDCLQIPNGPNMPGTPCIIQNTGLTGTWSSACECMPLNPEECSAGFWVIQAYDGEPGGEVSPIPFQLWVWNLSTGNGNMQFAWDFGDGTTSTEPFPTHTYPGTGPYSLCLTILDAQGCSDTYCDSISVNEDGLLGMPQESNVRSALTLNVLPTLPTGIGETRSNEVPQLWPNPATDLVHIRLNGQLRSTTVVNILDTHGRLIRTMSTNFSGGASIVSIPVDDLPEGIHLMEILNGNQRFVQRFVTHR
jgi:hypothetical protein